MQGTTTAGPRVLLVGLLLKGAIVLLVLFSLHSANAFQFHDIYMQVQQRLWHFFFPLGLTSLALGLEPRKSEKMSGSWKSRSTYAVDITIHGFAHDSRGSLQFIGQMLDKFQDGGQTKLCRFCDRGSMMPFSWSCRPKSRKNSRS